MEKEQRQRTTIAWTWDQVRASALTTILLLSLLHQTQVTAHGEARVQLPSFKELLDAYPGYAHYGGSLYNHQLISSLGLDNASDELLLHDTSALRLSAAFNTIGGPHSLGTNLIRLSKFGRDSVPGINGLQYIYHPIAYGPFLADKYGYPTVSKVHQYDPLDTKKNFWGQQGLLRVITYTHRENMPKGHVALWDCNHFHQAKDWISDAAGHSLITVEFWPSPDSDCSNMADVPVSTEPPQHHDTNVSKLLSRLLPNKKRPLRLRHRQHWEDKLLKQYGLYDQVYHH